MSDSLQCSEPALYQNKLNVEAVHEGSLNVRIYYLPVGTGTCLCHSRFPSNVSFIHSLRSLVASCSIARAFILTPTWKDDGDNSTYSPGRTFSRTTRGSERSPHCVGVRCWRYFCSLVHWTSCVLQGQIEATAGRAERACRKPVGDLPPLLHPAREPSKTAIFFLIERLSIISALRHETENVVLQSRVPV